jgi:eukaryotic-like serine/threonine-protein kinase
MKGVRSLMLGGRGAAICACTAVLVFTIALPAAGRAGGPQKKAAEHDWPGFRFNAAHSGVNSETIINSANAAQLTAGWTAALGADADSSPAVVLDKTNDIDTVYVGDFAGVMHAYNAATGAQLWTYQAGGKSDSIYSSPAVFDGVVYFASAGGILYALNASTGALDCSFATGEKIQASPTVVADADGSGPQVFIGSEAHGGEWSIYGVGNTHGQCSEDWFFDGFVVAPGGTWSSAAYGTDANGENLVVFGSKDNDDSVYALNAANGDLVWRYQTSDKSEQDVGSSPTISAPGVNGISDGAVYVEGKDHVVYALDLTTGTLLWSFNIATVNAKPGTCVSSPALVGNTVLVGSGVGLFALNAKTGLEDWNALTTTLVASSPAVSGGSDARVAFVGGLSNDLYAVNVTTGAVLWTATVTDGIYASPAVSHGVLFDVDRDGTLRTYAPS